MRRDLWMILILGCLLILFLEAPAAFSSVTADLDGPYSGWAESESSREARKDKASTRSRTQVWEDGERRTRDRGIGN